MKIEAPFTPTLFPAAAFGDGEGELVLRLQSAEVGLLLDIFEAALGTERISGLHTRNPALTHFFNSVYGGLLTTARSQGWGAT